jgi:hypothetical protein
MLTKIEKPDKSVKQRCSDHIAKIYVDNNQKEKQQRQIIGKK